MPSPLCVSAMGERGMKVYQCACGAQFKKRIWLREHIGICNPRWPRRTAEDQHWEIENERQETK